MSVKNKLMQYKSITKELPVFFTIVMANSVLVVLNFLYGKKRIGNILFFIGVASAQLIISAIITRFVWYRLNNTNDSLEISSILVERKSVDANKNLDRSKPPSSENLAKPSSHKIVMIVGLFAALQVISISLNLANSFLYKNHKIGISAYFATAFVAYALITIVTTTFTYNRIKDRKIKEYNNKYITQPTEQSNDSVKIQSVAKFDTKNKIELGLNFCVDSLARASEVIINFLYASSQISIFIYIGVILFLQSLSFFLLIYSTRDRLSGSKLLKEDNECLKEFISDDKVNQYIKDLENKLKSETKEDEKKKLEEGKKKAQEAKGNIDTQNNSSVMMSVFVISQILAIAGKITVPILYQQSKINTISYFALTFTTIIFSSLVMLVFSVNRECDKGLTQHNLTLVKITEFINHKI